MKRPSTNSRITIFWKPIDWILEVLAGVGVLANLALVIYHYGSLPEVIPRHYNAAGEPDGFSSKWIIWLLPLLTIALYAGLTWLDKIVRTLQFYTQVAVEKAPSHAQLTARMIRWVKLGVVVLFGYLTWGTIQTAMEKTDNLWSGLLPTVGVLLLLILAWYLIQYKRIGKG